MPLAVGATIRVPDDAYRFGEGPLTLRITEVLSIGPFEGRVWAEVRGHEVTPDGTLRARARFAFVRVDRVTLISAGPQLAGSMTRPAPSPNHPVAVVAEPSGPVAGGPGSAEAAGAARP
ncbi:hypothetical protein ABZ793_13025 [Micromonospora sp. NPDC047465]|uniref:hypothetical protein n=1 Tax=Micromonospora sp. NPDC047465 TaxID=3154813 RepID=UPI0033EBEF2F